MSDESKPTVEEPTAEMQARGALLAKGMEITVDCRKPRNAGWRDSTSGSGGKFATVANLTARITDKNSGINIFPGLRGNIRLNQNADGSKIMRVDFTNSRSFEGNNGQRVQIVASEPSPEMAAILHMEAMKAFVEKGYMATGQDAETAEQLGIDAQQVTQMSSTAMDKACSIADQEPAIQPAERSGTEGSSSGKSLEASVGGAEGGLPSD